MHRESGRVADQQALARLFAVGGAPARELAEAAVAAGMQASAVTYFESSDAAAPAIARRDSRRRRGARQGLARHEDGSDRGPDCGGVRLMLYELLYPLHLYAGIFNVTRYITFRDRGSQPDSARAQPPAWPVDDSQSCATSRLAR